VPGCTASPPNSSRPTTAFAPRLLFLIRPAILIPSPSRGRWFTCIRAVPSAAVSSMASNVHYARPFCTPTRSRPELAQREHRHALHAATLHVVARHGYSSSSCCRARTRLGLAASQVLPRLSLPRYCRARPRRPSCGSVPIRHASLPPAHARTARVLGPHRAAAHASETAPHVTARSGPFTSARVLLLHSHAHAACICAVLAPAA
jgi:hypothetical protein